jgi:hypothetical protein
MIRFSSASVMLAMVFSAPYAIADDPPSTATRPTRAIDPDVDARSRKLAAVVEESGKKVESAAKSDARYAATVKAIGELASIRDDNERIRRAKALGATASAIRADAVKKSGVDLNALSAKATAIFPAAKYVAKPAGSKIELPKPTIYPANWDFTGAEPGRLCPHNEPTNLAFTAFSKPDLHGYACHSGRDIAASVFIQNNQASRLEVTVPVTFSALSYILAPDAGASTAVEVGIDVRANSVVKVDSSWEAGSWKERRVCVVHSQAHSAMETGFMPELATTDKSITMKCGIDLAPGKTISIAMSVFVRVTAAHWTSDFAFIQTKLNVGGFDLEGTK